MSDAGRRCSVCGDWSESLTICRIERRALFDRLGEIDRELDLVQFGMRDPGELVEERRKVAAEIERGE